MAERNVSLLEDSVTGLKTSNGIKVPSITGGASTDNAVVRFDGTSGQVQNSGVTIDDNGNVGIGVTPGAWVSEVKVLQIGATASIANNNANATELVHNGCNGRYQISGQEASSFSQINGDFIWSTAPVGTAGQTIPLNNAMTLNRSGNLLVGTTTDNGVDKLQVNGGIRAIRYVSYNKILSSAGIVIPYDVQSKYIQIKTNGTAFNAAHIILSGFCYTSGHLMKLDCAGFADGNFTILSSIIKDINGNGVIGSWYKSSDDKLCLELVATTATGFSGSLLNMDLQRTLYSPSLLEILSYDISGTQSRY